MSSDEIVLEKAKNFKDSLVWISETAEGEKELFVQNSQGLLPSLTTVLLQEIEKFTRLLKVMDKSLGDMDDAINGYIVMDDVLDRMYVSIQNNQVPANWVEAGYLSLKPLSSWFKDLIERVKTID